MGTVELEIENIASLGQSLAIVTGINPKRRLETAFLGSSLFHMMNQNEFPTLIIPATVDFAVFREIGIALDLSKEITIQPSGRSEGGWRYSRPNGALYILQAPTKTLTR